ncbi:MAG: RluA family pseudouridine synthase [Bradymonadia bacterium]
MTPPLIHIISHRDGILAVHKPAGVAVHPGVEGQGPALTELLADQGLVGMSPIHRLDRETSGVVLLSDSADIRREMGQRFAEHAVRKHYLALVHGRPRKKGIVRRALADGRRKRPLEAVTRYRVIRWLGPVALMHVRPETGRKHQIRRHMQSIGHALVDDVRYPPKRGATYTKGPGRVCLHAWRIECDGVGAWEAPLSDDLAAQVVSLARAHGQWPEGAETPMWLSQLMPSTL